jgi:hypothetical protein
MDKSGLGADLILKLILKVDSKKMNPKTSGIRIYVTPFGSP